MSETGVVVGRDRVWGVNWIEDLEAMLSLRSLGPKRKQIPLETLVECMVKSSGVLAMVRNEEALEMFW